LLPEITLPVPAALPPTAFAMAPPRIHTPFAALPSAAVPAAVVPT
jgi:hypothetical protein